MNNQIFSSNRNSAGKGNKNLFNKINCANKKNKVKINGNKIPVKNKKHLLNNTKISGKIQVNKNLNKNINISMNKKRLIPHRLIRVSEINKWIFF